MKFPTKKYYNLKEFTFDYYKSFQSSFELINTEDLKKIIHILEKSYKSSSSKILICGNGGSAAIANHFACDHQKILFSTKKLKPFFVSLNSNAPLMTAISNDNNYESIFSDQVMQIGNKKDILITISSSGNSKNVTKAIKIAKKLGLKTISFTGFSGGATKKLANYNIHIQSFNYGIVESLHHTLMNIISQFLKNKYFSEKKIKKSFF
jgi:D-sedoheptulose 7-phosphate isomerase